MKHSGIADIPDEAASIIRNNKYLLQRYNEANLIADVLLPTLLKDPLFHEVHYGCEDYYNGKSTSSEFSTEDDDSISVDSFHSTYDRDFPTDSDGHDVQESKPSFPKKIIIRGLAGMGKSTLAAISCCRQDIRQAFDCICWVNVGKRMHNTFSLDIENNGIQDEKYPRNNLNYEMYRDCLRIIFKQLMKKNGSPKRSIAESDEYDKKYDGIHERFVEEVVCSSGDPPMQVAAKQVQAMLSARSEMAQILSSLKRNVLIILDDVWCNEDIDLFNFCCSGFNDPGSLSMLITTRKFDEAQLPETYTLSLGFLNELEGMKLLGWELGLAENFDFDELDISDRMLFLEISRKCGYLPLAIRMMGRSIRSMKTISNSTSEYTLDYVLKHVVMGWENQNPSSNNKAKASFENASMFAVFDRTFLLVASTAESSNFLKLCFGALAVGFTYVERLRPWISLDIVLLLWKALLESKNEDIVLALRNDGICKSNDVFKVLETLGAIDILDEKKRRYVRIGHDLLWEFGRTYLEINLPIEPPKYEDQNFWLRMKFTKPTNQIIDSSNVTSVFLNQHIVSLYEELTNGFFSTQIDDGHIYTYYPQHIIKGDLPEKAFNILNNQKFISTRLEVMGTDEAIHIHMQDIELLEKKYLCYAKLPSTRKSSKDAIMELVNSIVFATVSFDHSSRYIENSTDIHGVKMNNCLKARGLVIIGAAIQKFHLWNISMDCFSKAYQYLKFADFPSTHPEVTRIVRYIDTATLFPLLLVAKNSHQRITLKHSESLRSGNVLSGVPLVLSSHPGRAIVPLKNDFDHYPLLGYFCFLGIGSEESAMKVTHDGDFITRIEDGAVMNVAQGWLQEGVDLALKPGPRSEKERREQLKMTNGSRRFVINEDGTVSPKNCQNLVLGLCFHPKLFLVDRFSQNRAVFKNIDVLLKKKESDDDDDAVMLELLSHPNFAITPISTLVSHNLAAGCGHMKLGLGPKENSIKVVYRKNKIIVSASNYFFLCLYFYGAFAGNQVMLVGSETPIEHNFLKRISIKIYRLFLFSDFFINEDGTISPSNAPHLALGFQVPSFLNENREPVVGYTKDPLQYEGNYANLNATSLPYALVIAAFMEKFCKRNV